MAEERKKIDLKARLGKTPAPPPVAPASAPPPAYGVVPPPPRAPPPASSGAGLPGVPVGPPPQFSRSAYPAPGIDPSHPLAAVAVPYRPQTAPPPQAQRIEVDELAVQQASRSARKQGIVVGLVFAVVLGGVGYVAGGASEQGAGRAKSKNDAAELSGSVGKARDSLKTLGDKMEAGSKSLLAERKFPDALTKELGGLNVDFDGTQLAGRRFSGFPQETTHNLVEFITAVQAVNDRKQLIQGLLVRLQKPITEQLAAPPGQQKVSYVVAVDKDPSGNLAGFLSPLTAPIPVTAQNIQLPAKFAFANPGGGGNTELPRYSGGDIATKPAAIYVVPKTFDTVCPSAQSGQVAQLGAQIGEFIRTIRGEGQSAPAGEDAVQDSKPGLLERANKLVDELNKI
jgi:hypothetical protein